MKIKNRELILLVVVSEFLCEKEKLVSVLRGMETRSG